MAQQVRAVDDRHGEPQVGLVGPVAVHRFGVGHPGKRGRDRDPEGVPHHRGDHRLGGPDDVLDADERHLDVDLRELRLPVRAAVLVPEAADDLKVPLDPPDHQQLLEELGGLREDIELARVETAGHQEIARSFRGALDQHGGLDLEEPRRAQVEQVVIVDPAGHEGEQRLQRGHQRTGAPRPWRARQQLHQKQVDEQHRDRAHKG